ncbi:ISAs1 family transposase [Aliivibrio sp. S10_S31]|uniref:ISAs1 family transposase n=1 Tax=Aliivibrio sp. S10_S31 TaxID=2720224 RepID=UPI001680C0BE|nr:ISAs1 family transposase [Aliivibrio sp. S10_S31]
MNHCSKGEYLLAIKRNQGRLNEACNQHLNAVALSKYDSPSYATEEKAHGRTEKRMYFTCEPFDDFVDLAMGWPELKTLGIAVSHRIEGNDKTGEININYYICSAELDAESFAHSVRGHWGIESMYWSLDVSMREDECQISLGNGG